MFRRIFYISLYSVKEFLASKIFYFVIFLLLFSFFVSAIVGIMAVNEERKVLCDFFVASAQLTMLMFAIIYPPFSINLELETKRVYLVLSKSISRFEWFVSKFISFIVSSLILFLSVIVVSSFFMKIFKDYFFAKSYINDFLLIILKTSIILAISTSLSFIITSPYLTMVIVAMMWVSAHFASEIKYSLSYIKSTYDYVAYIIYLLPDFSSKAININNFFYLFFYSLLWLVAGVFSFEKREL